MATDTLPCRGPSLWSPDAVSFIHAVFAMSQVSQYAARSTLDPKEISTLSAGSRAPSLAPAGRLVPLAALGVWQGRGVRRGDRVSS